MKTKEQIIEGLGDYYGTLAYHRIGPKLVLTDGMKYLCESAECFWLADLVNSVLYDKKIFSYIKRQSPVVVSVKLDGNGGAVVKIGKIYEQKIDATDFPLDFFEFYIGDNGDFMVLMLFGEN